MRFQHVIKFLENKKERLENKQTGYLIRYGYEDGEISDAIEDIEDALLILKTINGEEYVE